MGNCGGKPADENLHSKPSGGQNMNAMGGDAFKAISANIHQMDQQMQGAVGKEEHKGVMHGVTFAMNNREQVVVDEGKTLGKGNYGVVYRGIHKSTGRGVAVKEILFPENDPEECEYLKQDFANEVKMCQRVNHPCCIKTLGWAKSPKYIIVQELVGFGSLHDMQMNSARPFRATGAQQVSMSLDMAMGMEYLHAQTPMIIHRDLKSLNLLVTDDYRIKITDFGMARAKAYAKAGGAAQMQTAIMTECGTPFWTAPEMFMGRKKYNEKVDQYAYAMTVLEIVQSKTPWNINPMLVQRKVCEGERPTIPHNCVPIVRSVIQKCWVQNPTQRPTFDRVVAELKSAP